MGEGTFFTVNKHDRCILNMTALKVDHFFLM